MVPWSDLAASFNDPHSRHAMLVHLPIVMGVLGFLPLAAWLILGRRGRTLPAVALCAYLLASGGAALAARAGEAAEERVEATLSPAAKGVLHDHEELGENGWVWPLIPAGLCAVAMFMTKPGVRTGAGLAGLAAGLGVGVWVGLTAHAGGKLVYVHGVGVGVPSATGPDATPRPDNDDD